MMTVPTNPIVEMLIGDSWEDITGRCRLSSASSGGGIEITRGVPNEGTVAEPTAVSLTLNNIDGEFSPNNPNGSYFGLLGRNQPIRIGVDRQIDTFNRTEANQVGWMPDRVLDDITIPGDKWHVTGNPSTINVNGSGLVFNALGSGMRFASFGEYGDCDIRARMKVSSRDTEMGIMARVARTDMAPPAGLDPTFESGIQGWSASSGTLVQDTSIKHNGAASIKMTVTGAPATASIGAIAAPSTMYGGLITPAGNYRLRYWVRCSISTTVRQQISFYDEDGTTFRGSVSQDVAIVANTWTMCELIAAAVQDAGYIRPLSIIQGSPAAGTQLWLDDVEVIDLTQLRWYTANFVPGATDQVKFGKVSPGLSRSVSTDWNQQLLVDTYYWMRVQMTGQRMRMKMWKDGDDEPTDWYWRYFDDVTVSEIPIPQIGEIGLFAGSGTGNVTFDSFQVDIWRAHAEIAELPQRWDLSREDRWVPVQARGILRRLGQGRKALQSALSLHLNSYTADSKGWWSLESDTGDSAGNNIEKGTAGKVSGLTFSAPELTGTALLPGASGYASFDTDTASFTANTIPHSVVGGKETFLWFMRIPSLPASEVTVATLTNGGTIRTWKINITSLGRLRVIGTDRGGTVLVDQTSIMWNENTDLPTGCWIACTLYLLQNGGNIEWALNHHRPGSDTFWTNSGVVAGTVGAYTGIWFKSSSVLTAAGSLQVTQVMHYAGDLPFVTYDFSKAALAYLGETAADRYIRLCANAGVQATTMGYTGTSTPMGYQLPGKLLDLLDECAQAESTIITESRDDFELCMTTRTSTWNRFVHSMDIDEGHLSEPLDPNQDDQQTRNDVTISRENGGFRRSVQIEGPLNTNLPEDDPDGIGTYEEQTSINFAYDYQCQSLADWKRSKGTQKEPRYPSMRADLTATAYRDDPALAAAVLSIDSCDVIEITNPEADYAPREQMVSGYAESIDQFDWDLTFTALPAAVNRVGVVGYTFRVGSESNYTSADFVAGTDTKLLSTLTGSGSAWVDLTVSEASMGFEIEASGVRLWVEAVGEVLNSNPGFETGTTTGWAATSGNVTIARERYSPKRGTYCCRITAAAAGTDGIVQDSAFSSDVAPALDYLVSGWIKTEAAATDLRLVVDWYQSNNSTLISTSSPTAITTLANTWTWFSAVVTSPALAQWARLRARNVFAGATRMWVDDLRIMPVSSYASDPQTLTVRQAPTNDIIKTIPAGSQILLARPQRVAW